MTIVLMLCMFAIFLLIDYFRKGKTVKAEEPVRSYTPSLIGGFRLPENLSYHLGHTWALSESPTLVRVGMDEFAAKLIGKIDALALPARGTWVRQGQKFATITRDGKTMNLVSPIEGTVADINDAAIADPETARKDAFKSGWFMTVQSPDQKINFRNLLNGNLARRWMEEAAMRMHPAYAQDGGEAVDDFAVAAGKDWEAAAKEYFLN